jgi:hypothetical protein
LKEAQIQITKICFTLPQKTHPQISRQSESFITNTAAKSSMNLHVFLHQLLVGCFEFTNFTNLGSAVIPLDVPAQTKIRAQSPPAVIASEPFRCFLAVESLVMLKRALIHETLRTFVAFVASRCLVLLEMNFEASFVIKFLAADITAVHFLRVCLHVMIEAVFRDDFLADATNFLEPIELEVTFVALLLHGRWEAIVAVTTVKCVDDFQVRLLNLPETRMFLPSRRREALSATNVADGVRNLEVDVHVIFEIFVFRDFVAAQVALVRIFEDCLLMFPHVVAE